MNVDGGGHAEYEEEEEDGAGEFIEGCHVYVVDLIGMIVAC